MKGVVILIVSFFIAGNTVADNCNSLIQHGLYNEARKSSSVNSYQEGVNNICNDYESFKRDKQSGNVKGSYGAISGKAGYAAETYEKLSKSMCSESGSVDDLAKDKRVLQKIISPEALAAFEKCISLSGNGLKVHTIISEKGDHISVSLHYAAVGINGNNQIKIQQPYITSPEQFTCGGSLVADTMLPVNTNVEYHCSREITGNKNDIFIYQGRRMYANSATLAIPTSTATIYREIPPVYAPSIPSPLKGAVVSFNSKACPDGWSEYTKARGRFIRGLDKSNTVDKTKNRKPGDHQEDAFQGHTHAIQAVTSKDHGPNNQYPHGYHNGGFGLVVDKTKYPQSADGYGRARIADETRPKNVSLLYCKKD